MLKWWLDGTFYLSFRLQMQKITKQRGRKQARRGGLPKSMGYSPVPNAFRTTMSYFTAINLVEAAAGTGVFYTFQLNNLYDPNYTGAGKQPTSFDQWSTLYNRFRVMNVEVQLENVSNINAPMSVGYIITPASTLPADIDAWPTQRICGHAMISYNTGGNAVSKMHFRVQPWLGLSLTKRQYVEEADYSHSSTAGPSRPLYLHLWARGYSGVIGNSIATLVMKYSVELSEPTALSTS